MVAFCAISTFLFQGFSFLNLRKGFFVYIACLPLLPAYIAIPLVKGGAGISLSRLLTYALVLALISSFIRNTSVWLGVIKKIWRWPSLVIFMSSYYFFKLLSTVINQDSISLVYWLDEIFASIVIYLLAVRYITSVDELKKILLVLVSVLIIHVGIVYIEVLLNHPILHEFVEINVSTVGERIAEGFERDGTYRAVGMFENPLSLTEYFLIGITLLFGMYRINGCKSPYIFYFLVSLVILAITFTGARFSVFSIMLGAVVSSLFYNGYRLHSYSRLLIYIFSSLIFLPLVYFAYHAITDVYWFLEILSSYGGGIRGSKCDIACKSISNYSFRDI